MPALPSRGSAAPAALSRAGASPVLALVLSVALSLVLLPAAGCTQAADPVVTGAFGARPAVVLPSGAPPSEVRVAEVVTGRGERLGSEGVAVVQHSAHRWDGRLVTSTFNRGVPAAVPLDASPWDLLAGRPAGSRVTAAAPDMFHVIDILGWHAPDAAVEAGPATVAGVRVSGGAPPAVEVPAAPPPGFAAAVLARGSGPRAETGRLLVVQYVAVSWTRRRVVASTWERGRPEAVTMGDGSVIGGWDRALRGVPAGSRVAMVVPPGDAYGMTGGVTGGMTGGMIGADGVEPGETLVCVVDLLGVH